MSNSDDMEIGILKSISSHNCWLIKLSFIVTFLLYTFSSVESQNFDFDTLRQNLQSDEPQIRRQAARNLEYVNDPQRIELLIQTLRDPEPVVRWQAAIILGNIRDRRSVPALIYLLTDHNALVRSGAISALTQLNDPRAFDNLLRLLNDPDSSNRADVIKALENEYEPSRCIAIEYSVVKRSRQVR